MPDPLKEERSKSRVPRVNKANKVHSEIGYKDKDGLVPLVPLLSTEPTIVIVHTAPVPATFLLRCLRKGVQHSPNSLRTAFEQPLNSDPYICHFELIMNRLHTQKYPIPVPCHSSSRRSPKRTRRSKPKRRKEKELGGCATLSLSTTSPVAIGAKT